MCGIAVHFISTVKLLCHNQDLKKLISKVMNKHKTTTTAAHWNPFSYHPFFSRQHKKSKEKKINKKKSNHVNHERDVWILQ